MSQDQTIGDAGDGSDAAGVAQPGSVVETGTAQAPVPVVAQAAASEWLEPLSPPPAARPDTVQGSGLAVPPLPALPEGTQPGWYRTTVDGGASRYWDGAAWTDRVSPVDVPKMSYAERFRRLYPIVLLVAVGLNALASLPRLLGANPLANLSSPVRTGAAVVAIVSLFLGAAFWSAILALIPRSAKPASAPVPWYRRLLPWALLAAIVVAPLIWLSLTRVEAPATITVSSPADGCQKFLDTIDTAASKKLSNTASVPYLQALHDAAVTTDPDLAADLQKAIDAPTNANFGTLGQSVIGRCVTDGHLTPTQVTDWANKIKAYG